MCISINPSILCTCFNFTLPTFILLRAKKEVEDNFQLYKAVNEQSKKAVVEELKQLREEIAKLREWNKHERYLEKLKFQA